jgi:predicted nucleic acid-binding protein
LARFITPKLSSRLLTDAYFAALARRAGLRLVTFDGDFERFGQLPVLRLSADEH